MTTVIVYAGETNEEARARDALWSAERKALLGYSNGRFIVKGRTCVDQSRSDHVITYLHSPDSVGLATTRHRDRLEREAPSLRAARARREALTRPPEIRVSDTWPYDPLDDTPPSLVSIVIDSTGTSAELTYDERLDANSVPASSAYTLTGTSAAVTAVAIPANMATVNRKYRHHVKLTLAPAALSGQTIALSYTQPSSGKIRDAAGNNASAFAAHAVTNGSTVP